MNFTAAPSPREVYAQGMSPKLLIFGTLLLCGCSQHERFTVRQMLTITDTRGIRSVYHTTIGRRAAGDWVLAATYPDKPGLGPHLRRIVRPDGKSLLITDHAKSYHRFTDPHAKWYTEPTETAPLPFECGEAKTFEASEVRFGGLSFTRNHADRSTPGYSYQENTLYWPRGGCIPIERMGVSRLTGMIAKVYELSTDEITFAEPKPELFDLPSGYRELAQTPRDVSPIFSAYYSQLWTWGSNPESKKTESKKPGKTSNFTATQLKLIPSLGQQSEQPDKLSNLIIPGPNPGK